MATKVWAHRGASGYAPENTLEAFQTAVEMGADGIELDISLSHDGEIVVAHDETLDRVSDGVGLIKNYTLAELKGFNFSKTMPGFARTQIPTLAEVLDLIKGTDLTLNIEIKNGRVFYEGIEEKAIRLVEAFNMSERVWYSSFNHYSMLKVKELCPAAKCGALYSGGIYKPAQYAKSLKLDAIHPAYDSLHYPGLIEECKSAGIEIHSWTANTHYQMQRCVRLGIDAMITNYPDLAKAFAQEPDKMNAYYPFDNPFAKNPDMDYYLFGAGNLGFQFIRRLDRRKKPILVLDNQSGKWGAKLEGIEIASPEYLKPTDTVIIASGYFKEIAAQLRSIGGGGIDYYIYDEASDWD